MFGDVLVSVFVIQPGIHATSCARCASENDFACGFHWPLSLGTRSSTRRVVAISRSNSESSVLEMLMWDLGSRIAVCGLMLSDPLHSRESVALEPPRDLQRVGVERIEREGVTHCRNGRGPVAT